MPTPPNDQRHSEIPRPVVRPPRDGHYERRLAEIITSAPPDENLLPLYLGRAGESYVAAHLLRRGLNSSPVSVDTGVDLLGYREILKGTALLQAEYELYQFQVKTTASTEYRVSMPVRKVHELWHKAINLVVVFWSEEKSPAAVVLPPSLVRMLTSGGFEDPRAPLPTSGDEVSVRVFESQGRYFIRNLENEVTAMKNRFDRVEPIGIDTCQFPPYACWADGPGMIKIGQ
jgi:hypothetical protein